MRDFSNTQIQILGTLREYEFAVAKGAYALANRIREANTDLRVDFDRIDFDTFKKGEKLHISDRGENAEQYGGPDR